MRAVWWIGVPAIVIGWFLQSHRMLLERPAALYTLVEGLWTTAPAAAMLVVEYSFTIAAIAIAIVAAAWSHRRRSGAVRVETLLLPTFIAGLEACVHLGGFASCRGLGYPMSLEQLHTELHVAATASAIAMAAPLLFALVLPKTLPAGVSGTLRTPFRLAAFAAMASVMILWASFDGLILHPPL